jgi:hypothetical protein
MANAAMRRGRPEAAFACGPMPIQFGRIRQGFEHAAMGGSIFGEHTALLCRQTGKITLHVDYPDDPALFDDLPEDFDDEKKYIAIPDKRQLGLGKPLVLAFAREVLPDDFDQVRAIFDRKGAYPRFKALLMRRHALERWHAFENKATDQALRDWCALNEIDLAD